jgi:quercetin dioxygenase-like cupin family protein
MSTYTTRVLTLLVLLSIVATAGMTDVAARDHAALQAVTIARNGSRPSLTGPAQNFTGAVRVDPLFDAKEPSRVSGAYVTFAPRARSAWHTHPNGQTLIVTAGSGRVQRWGGSIQEIRPGDVVSIPPGQKHWHGASPTTAMTHIAIQENVEWMAHVTDEQYGK